MQVRTEDDAYDLGRMDFGIVPTGHTSHQVAGLLWNARPVQVTAEQIGTGDGTTVSFQTAFYPLVSSPNAPIAVRVDGTPATGVTIDHENGLVIFNNPPANGTIIACDYHYSPPSNDTTAVVLTLEEIFHASGNGTTQEFSLPTPCVHVISLHVAGVEQPTTAYSIIDGGTKLVFLSAPAAGDAIKLTYIDAVVQNGYYEVRSNGIENPYSQTNFDDDLEVAFTKLGGLFEYVNRLVGTGDGTTQVFDIGTPMIRECTRVTVGGTEVTGYSLNRVLGVITFDTAPGNAAEIRMDYNHERAHKIGNIRKWTARRFYARGSLPQDANSAQLTAQLIIVTQ